MRSIIKITVTLFILFVYFEGRAQWTGIKKVVGSGNVTTKTLSTGDYDMIKSVGSIDIHLIRGTEGNIQVTTDDNLHEYLEIEVSDNSLILTTKKDVYLKTKEGINVTVPFETISKVTLTGSGDIDTKDMIKANKFKVAVVGSGDIVLAVEASEVDVDVTGSGDVTLSGSTANLEVDLTGSGDFKGSGLDSQNTDVTVSGSGNAKVVAKADLKARVNGSGSITYKGNPDKKDIKTFGSGDISSY